MDNTVALESKMEPPASAFNIGFRRALAEETIIHNVLVYVEPDYIALYIMRCGVSLWWQTSCFCEGKEDSSSMCVQVTILQLDDWTCKIILSTSATVG